MLLDLLYNNFALPLLRVGLAVAKVWTPKLQERDRQLRQAMPDLAQVHDAARVLFHAASMGELEQLLPVVGALKQRTPNMQVIVSCTSPSGYKHALTQQLIDAAVYLPIDTRSAMRAFVARIAPDAVVINRYDVWPNFVRSASARCPVLLVNATLPSAAASPLLKKWVASYYRTMTAIVAVTNSDAQQLGALIGKPVPSMPDTRIDRVRERVATAHSSFDFLRDYSRVTLILGSSWQPDEDLVMSALEGELSRHIRLVIVPHEPTERALQRIESRIQCTRLSATHELPQGHILVDSVGKLLSLYRIADAAFVGGGFGVGVHSTTEPAVYGIPVACGPRIERSRDASALSSAGLVRVVHKEQDVRTWIADSVLHAYQRDAIKDLSRKYLEDQSGSAEHYARLIESLLAVND